MAPGQSGERPAAPGRGCRKPGQPYAGRGSTVLRVYFDTSVVVALIAEDIFSSRAEALVMRHDPEVVLSDLARTEFASVLALRVRSQQAAASAALDAFAKLDAWAASAATTASVISADLAQAEQFIRAMDLNLRTQDAVHIAMARRLGLPIATFDRRLGLAARTLGVTVLDP